MSGLQRIALSIYPYATRDSELARFQMFSAYTGPTSVEFFNHKFGLKHARLLKYNEEMGNAAWGLVKQIFAQTEQFAQVQSLAQLNSYPVFSLGSLARMIKMSKTETKVTAVSAQNYIWSLVCDFKAIYDGIKPQDRIVKMVYKARHSHYPNIQEIRTLLAPDSQCTMSFMRQFPDKPQDQTDFLRYHCLLHFQDMVMKGSNFILGKECSFANPIVACFVIDALERLCVAPVVGSDPELVEWLVSGHYCTSTTRTTAVDKDLQLLLCSYAIPFVEDWDRLNAQQDEEEEAPEVPQEDQNELPKDAQEELTEENKELAQEDPKPAVVASE